MISHEEAMKIALRYLGEQEIGSLAINDTLPDYAKIYVSFPLKDLWFVPVSNNISCFGSGRIICISKKTDK